MSCSEPWGLILFCWHGLPMPSYHLFPFSDWLSFVGFPIVAIVIYDMIAKRSALAAHMRRSSCSLIFRVFLNQAWLPALIDSQHGPSPSCISDSYSDHRKGF